jgi:sarcosine oxidase
MQHLARSYGAQLRPNTSVTALRPSADGGEIDVVTQHGDEITTVRVGSVVICADAWTNRLLAPLGHHIPLAVTREQVSYFASHGHDLEPGRFPVWIWMHDPSFYGFPVYGQIDAVKASEDCGGAEVDPDTRTFDPDPAMEQRLGEFMQGLLGYRLGRPASKTCLYTLTSDRDFVVDRLPDHPNICVGLGAAHGFKFAAWFGQALAGLAAGGMPGPDLAPVSYERPSLQVPIDRAAWLV